VDFTIFYAWQSDVDPKCNRFFIRDALARAIKHLNANADIEDSPVLDHDTKDVPGTPDVFTTIMQKIESCGIFVADVTLVATTPGGKRLCNPNVMIELGYALARVGDKRIILILNDAMGSPEELPFDLSRKRWPITYTVAASIKPTATDEKLLADAIAQAIRAVLESTTVANGPQVEQKRWGPVRRRVIGQLAKAHFAAFNAAHFIMRYVLEPIHTAPYQASQLFIQQLTDSVKQLRERLSSGVPALSSDMTPYAVTVLESSQQALHLLRFFAEYQNPSYGQFDFVGTPPWSDLQELHDAIRPFREDRPDVFEEIASSGVVLLSVEALRSLWDRVRTSGGRMCFDPKEYAWRTGRTPLVLDVSYLTRLRPNPTGEGGARVYYG
jgi:hypothetical protein